MTARTKKKRPRWRRTMELQRFRRYYKARDSRGVEHQAHEDVIQQRWRRSDGKTEWRDLPFVIGGVG